MISISINVDISKYLFSYCSLYSNNNTDHGHIISGNNNRVSSSIVELCLGLKDTERSAVCLGLVNDAAETSGLSPEPL